MISPKEGADPEHVVSSFLTGLPRSRTRWPRLYGNAQDVPPRRPSTGAISRRAITSPWRRSPQLPNLQSKPTRLGIGLLAFPFASSSRSLVVLHGKRGGSLTA